MEELVVLVDKDDNEIGVAQKLEAHLEGWLHRAFSVFIFNDEGDMLLHQRANNKYHSGGLWTNACCGHPRPNENTLDAAKRRLYEEMGIHCVLEHKFSFTYKASLNNNLIEHEIDHVFFGKFDYEFEVNKNEVQNYEWMHVGIVEADVYCMPERYTEWFKICLERVVEELGK